MPEFQMDTEGAVALRPFESSVAQVTRWNMLDSFTQGYLEALFFTNCDPSVSMVEIEPDHEFQDGNIPADAGFSDLHPDSLASIIAECAAFQRDQAALLESAYALEPGRYSNGNAIDARRAGQFFGYARCGHGIGWADDFATSDTEAACLEALQGASRKAGNRDVLWGAAVDGAESPTGYGWVFVS